MAFEQCVVVVGAQIGAELRQFLFRLELVEIRLCEPSRPRDIGTTATPEPTPKRIRPFDGFDCAKPVREPGREPGMFRGHHPLTTRHSTQSLGVTLLVVLVEMAGYCVGRVAHIHPGLLKPEGKVEVFVVIHESGIKPAYLPEQRDREGDVAGGEGPPSRCVADLDAGVELHAGSIDPSQHRRPAHLGVPLDMTEDDTIVATHLGVLSKVGFHESWCRNHVVAEEQHERAGYSFDGCVARGAGSGPLHLYDLYA